MTITSFFTGNKKPEIPKESSASRVPEQTSAKDEDYISIIIGALAALIVILTIIVVFVIIRHKRRQNNNRNNLKPAADNVLSINLNNFHGTSNGKVSNGNVYNGVATDEEHVKEVNGEFLNMIHSIVFHFSTLKTKSSLTLFIAEYMYFCSWYDLMKMKYILCFPRLVPIKFIR